MTAMNMSACPQCEKMGLHNPVAPHRVCPKCGYYKGRPVLQIKVKEKKKTP
jgi:large subunit ribosomal protein L32